MIRVTQRYLDLFCEFLARRPSEPIGSRRSVALAVLRGPTRASCFGSRHVSIASKTCLRQHRPGMILAIVLVVLLVVLLLGAALANAFLAQRQHVRQCQQQQQAFWLAESAMHRAAHRLASDSGYQGETWEIPPGSLDGTHAGVVTVHIDAVSEPKPGHQIRIAAWYPSNALKPLVQYRELFVTTRNELSR